MSSRLMTGTCDAATDGTGLSVMNVAEVIRGLSLAANRLLFFILVCMWTEPGLGSAVFRCFPALLYGVLCYFFFHCTE